MLIVLLRLSDPLLGMGTVVAPDWWELVLALLRMDVEKVSIGGLL